MFVDLILCIIGLAALVYAADKLVEAASNLALNFGVSKMVIGLTIVAAGTSLPEFVVSLNSSIKGNPALSLGNVVGSNIMNIALILGITALILPINSTKAMVRREIPIMIGVTALAWIFAKTDSVISPNEGLVLILIFIAYNIMSYVIGKREAIIAEEFEEEAERIVTVVPPEKESKDVEEKAAEKEEEKTNESQSQNQENKDDKENKKEKMPGVGTNILFIIIGLVGMVIGSELLVKGAISIAKAIGVSNELIGLTLVAIGTSLPELATSIVAARKGQSDLSVGNVLGSNIFNITAIVGTAALVPYFTSDSSSRIFLNVSTEMLTLHIPIMMVVAVVLLPIMITDMKISRKEGAFFLGIYLCYIIMLFQTAMPKKADEITKDSVAVEQTTTIPASSSVKIEIRE